MILKAKFRFNRPKKQNSDSTDLSTQVRILFQPRMLLPLPYLEKSIRSIF